MYFGYYHMLGRLRSLRTLKLCDFDRSQFTMEDEEWLDQLQSLQEIQFSSCRSLLHLPSNLNNMFNLRKIIMNDCCKLHSLPLNGLRDDLKELHSSGGSDVLEQQCQKVDGDEWAKISHVPYIHINGKTIQMLWTWYLATPLTRLLLFAKNQKKRTRLLFVEVHFSV